MTTPIKFKIVRRADRKSLVLRFWDDQRESWVERSTGVGRRRDAARMVDEIVAIYHRQKTAAGNQPETDCGQDLSQWADFRAKYDMEKASKLANPGVWKSAVNLLDQLLKPRQLADVNAALLSRFEAKLRARGLKDSTIGSYLKHIRAALGWASDMEIINKAPRIRLPKASRTSKQMKGRPLTTEEFDRILEEYASIVGDEQAGGFMHASKMLWLTGLRLGEVMRVHWDDTSQIHIVGIDTRRPMLAFPDTEHKQREDALVPLTPDAVNYLRAVPGSERNRRLVTLKGKNGHAITTSEYVGRIISRAGKAARVIVEARSRREKQVDGKWIPKYASAQDFRRSFGERWSYRVMPTVLMHLMRHKSIETTLKYYVGRNAERLADEVWDAFAQFAKRSSDVTLDDYQSHSNDVAQFNERFRL